MNILNELKTKIRAWLIWSQKYTQTDNIYLAKGGFYITLERILLTGTAFLLSIAFANLLEPATYGNYKYILSLVGVFGILSLGGIDTAIIQATARGLEGSFYSGFKTKLRWTMLASLAAIGTSCYYWLQGNYLLAAPLLISAIFLPLMQASRIYGHFLAGRKLFGVGVKYSVITQFVFVAAMAVTLFLTKNLFWVIAVYFVSNTALNCFFYLLTKVKFQPNKKEDPKTLSFGKHLTFTEVISRATKQLDKVLLFNFIGPAQVAIYAFATSIPNQLGPVLGQFNILAFPKLAVKSREEIRATLIKKVGKLFFLVGAIIGIYILIAPYIYKLFFPKYLASVSYSQVFMLSFIVQPIYLLGIAFQAKMMKKEVYLLKVPSGLRLLLFFVLVPFYGIWGAIFAWLAAEIFRGALILFLFYLAFWKKTPEPV